MGMYYKISDLTPRPVLTEIRCVNVLLAYRIKRVLEAQGYWVFVIGHEVYFNHKAV